MIVIISSQGDWDGFLRRRDEGECVDVESSLSWLARVNRRRGREGSILETYSPRWRHASAIASVENEYTRPSTVYKGPA